MTPRERMKAAAECNFTAELVGSKCEDCDAKLKPAATVYWFSSGESSEGTYVADCCVGKYLPPK